MNKETETILVWVIGVAFFCYFAFITYEYWLSKRFLRTIPHLSTEALKYILEEEKISKAAVVIPELEERNIDMRFALPKLIDIATSKNVAARMLGWHSIDKHFPEIRKKIEYDPTNPSTTDKDQLKQIKKKHIKSLQTTRASARV